MSHPFAKETFHRLHAHLHRVKSDKHLLIIYGLVVVCLILVVFAGFAFLRLQNVMTDEEIVVRVGGLMMLPQEKPQVISLDDPVRLAQMKDFYGDFYQTATSGDKLLQYNGRAVLYRPRVNKVLNVVASRNGVFNVEIATQTLLISLRFNEGDAARVYSFKNQIDRFDAKYQVIEADVSRVKYKNDVIYVVRPEKMELIKKFAQLIGDSPIVEALEIGEDPTQADIIVSFR